MRVFTQGRRDGAGGTRWPEQRAEAKLCSERKDENEALSTAHSAISTYEQSFDVTRLLQALQNPLVDLPMAQSGLLARLSKKGQYTATSSPSPTSAANRPALLRAPLIPLEFNSNHQVHTSPPVPQVPNLRGEALRSLDPWPYAASS